MSDSQRHHPVEQPLYDAALEQLAAEEYQINAEDIARLSPLVFGHINLLGRYAFAVLEAVNRG